MNLEPPFASIDDMTPAIDAAVERLFQATGRAPIIVTHSMGGLATRAWLARSPAHAARIAHVVTIGTPHAGTWLARWGLTTNARQMRPGSRWLEALSAKEATLREAGAHVDFTCFHGHADNIVFPPSLAVLAGSTVRHVSATPHVAMAYHPVVVAEVARLLQSVDSACGEESGVAGESPAMRVAP